MPHPSNVSYPRGEYYRRYYWNNKHRYILNYQEKKYRRECFEEIYKPYGGERKYHYNALMKWLKEENEIIKDLSNINLN